MNRISPQQIIDIIHCRYRSAVYLTVRQVTRLLCLHRSTVYRMIEDGAFDRYGGIHKIVMKDKIKVLIPKSTLINYLKENLHEY